MRDEFNTRVKQILGSRAAFKCSNPKCRVATIGPTVDSRGVINLGVAAHITAASTGGPRFDEGLTPEQRSDVANGIWLCQRCAKLVDSDLGQFTVELLRGWKVDCELKAAEELQDPFKERESRSFIESENPPDSVDRGLAWKLYQDHKFGEAVVEFKKWLVLHPKDYIAWTVLAWCHYEEFHYKDGLSAVNKALAVKRDLPEAMGTKACILAEEGIEKGARASLLQARELFERVAGSLEHWTIHYNLANTLCALGEFDSSIEEYRKAIKLNDRLPCIWKNLAHAYFKLGDHKGEFECYDKALALDPMHTEALISKGVTLITALKKPLEGIPLIEGAVARNPEAGDRWPHLWYWLGIAYWQGGNAKKALEHVQRGLDIAPNHTWLLELKGQLLSDLCKTNSEFTPQAIGYFKFRLSLSKTDYKAFAELGSLFLLRGDEDAIWKLIDDQPSHFNLKASDCFRQAGVLAKDAFRAWCYLPAYETFRGYASHKDYFDILPTAKLPVDRGWFSRFAILMTVPFGEACEILRNKESSKSQQDLVVRIHDHIRDWIRKLLPPLAVPLAKSLDKCRPAKEHAAEIADLVSSLMVWMGDVANRELSRQLGYTCAYFAIPTEEIEHFMDKDPRIGKMMEEVALLVFTSVHEDLKLLPDKKES